MTLTLSAFGAILIHAVAASLMVMLPLAAAFQARRSKYCSNNSSGDTNRLFRIGTLGFVASQVAHVPFNYFLLTPFLVDVGLQPDGTFWNPEDEAWPTRLGWSFCMALSAGIFEEVTRWIIYRHWIVASVDDEQEERLPSKYSTAVLLGVGHGGCEAFLVGCMSLFALVQMSLLRWVLDEEDLKHQMPWDQFKFMEHTMHKYWAMPWSAVMMAPLERVWAMTAHVAMSILVWRGFAAAQQQQPRAWKWLLGAISFHTALDIIAVFVLLTWSVYWVETAWAASFFPLSLYVIYCYAPEESRHGFEPLVVVQEGDNGGDHDHEAACGANDEEALETTEGAVLEQQAL